MLKIGITGGIGSGKSTVAKMFQLLGLPLYNADDAAKELMNSSAEIREKLIKAFGEETYTDKGLNRSWLAAKVFNQPEQLQLLNSIVHPVVIAYAAEWMSKQDAPYVMKEAALFFES